MEIDPLPYWIGFDAREKDAYDVAMFSAQRKSTIPLYVQALKHKNLRDKGLFSRRWEVNESGNMFDVLDGQPFSTEFAFTRFLVPALQDYKGWALFTDCDVLWVDDIGKLAAAKNDDYAVMVAKVDHKPTNSHKMDKQIQKAYPRKNWSSVILWNCGHPSNQKLTPEVVNTQPGSFLHRFQWLKDREIGDLDLGWNFLVGHTSRKIKPRLMHFTDGGPWFDHMRDCAFSGWWMSEYDHMMKVRGRFE